MKLTLQPIERYILWGIILFLAFAALSRFLGCNPAYKDSKIVFVDSSKSKEYKQKTASYDKDKDAWSSERLKLLDSIDLVNGRLKTSKNRFYTKYREIIKDSLITDSNCLWTLESANYTLMQYDSLLILQTKRADICFEQSVSRDSLITFLREFSNLKGQDNNTLIEALSRFKHVFWRIYWRSKR